MIINESKFCIDQLSWPNYSRIRFIENFVSGKHEVEMFLVKCFNNLGTGRIVTINQHKDLIKSFEVFQQYRRVLRTLYGMK